MQIVPCKSASYLLVLGSLCCLGVSSHASEQSECVCEALVATKETFYRKTRIIENDFVVPRQRCNKALIDPCIAKSCRVFRRDR